MTSVYNIDGGDQLINAVHHLSVLDQDEIQDEVVIHEKACGHHGGVCAICLDKIALEETALVKGCEHAYCVTCILRWASCSQKQTCPQCKLPFEFLNVHRSLDGSIQDYMFEESVCLLLRASWFKPLVVKDHQYAYDDQDDYYYPYAYEYEDEDEDEDLVYMGSSSHLRIGNRRWGDNGYVRAGRQEARPAQQRPDLVLDDSGTGSSREPKKKVAVRDKTRPNLVLDDFGGSSREPKKKEGATDKTGRRAKRTLKREAADRAAAAKHQEHLVRLGRK